MDDWRDIGSAPRDATPVRLRLANGVECIGEYWPAPPPEIDPEQTCQGWAVQCMDALFSGRMDDLDSPPVAWLPLAVPLDGASEELPV